MQEKLENHFCFRIPNYKQNLSIKYFGLILKPFLDKKPSHINSKKNKKLALNSGIQTYQILTNDDEVCIPSLFSILLAVLRDVILFGDVKILFGNVTFQFVDTKVWYIS